MRYEGNPKHKEPWQRCRRGSLCPAEITATLAQQLLTASELVENARYATHGGIAYCARCHGDDHWHGYPVGWVEVPESLRRRWKREGRVSAQDMRQHWH
jgi:hypothetical protein